MAQKIVAGNWKMNLTKEDGVALASEVVNMVNDEVSSDVKVIMATPFTHLSTVKGIIGDSTKVGLAAQNCSNKVSGAFTGEVSVSMLKSFGIEYVIIGHSERREYFNETNAELAEKTKLILAEGLTPIFCCGEPLEIREKEAHVEYVKTQLSESLFDLSEEDFSKIIIAYEPIWAIGTGVTASSAQAQETHAAIRTIIAEKYGQSVADDTSLLYGGSCKPANAQELFACADVDGGLIGGAALQSRSFVDIAKSY